MLVFESLSCHVRFSQEKPESGEFELYASTTDDVETYSARDYLTPVHFPHQQVSVEHLVLFNHSQFDDSVNEAFHFSEQFWMNASGGESDNQFSSSFLDFCCNALDEADRVFALCLAEYWHQRV